VKWRALIILLALLVAAPAVHNSECDAEFQAKVEMLRYYELLVKRVDRGLETQEWLEYYQLEPKYPPKVARRILGL
jgi:hypothetical protein